MTGAPTLHLALGLVPRFSRCQLGGTSFSRFALTLFRLVQSSRALPLGLSQPLLRLSQPLLRLSQLRLRQREGLGLG